MRPLVPIVSGKTPPATRRRVAVLGSTGSIGRSTLDIIRSNPESFEPFALVAGKDSAGLAAQCAEFSPRFAALATEGVACDVGSKTEFLCGEAAIAELAGHPDVDVVVAAVVGSSGLRAVLSAVRAGKFVALANKESLVCAGRLVAELQAVSGATIVPVDSEHSALFQALQGAKLDQVSKFILTASGGPFLNASAEQLAAITPAQAVNHPRWKMGAKISVDSATLVNKALEVIEACWLFGVAEERVAVLVHPESIVHSLVDFCDGSQIAQLSVPDMRGAISYAINYPNQRLAGIMSRLQLEKIGTLHFMELDQLRFPAVSIARSAMREGGAMPAIFNQANEEAVRMFLENRVAFVDIVPIIERTLSEMSGTGYTDESELFAVMTAAAENARRFAK